MSWTKDILTILTDEPETWLAYLYGQQLENIPHLTRDKPLFRGVFWRMASFFCWLVSRTRLRSGPSVRKKAKCRFLVLADTENQLSSLSGTVDALRTKGESVLAICKPNFLDRRAREQGYVPYHFGPVEVVRGGYLLCMRWHALRQDLGKKKPVATEWYLDRFCATYFHLIYFYRLLTKVRPEFVVTANDHNVPNRCLLAVANHLGVKTVYLQHASVGRLFPALQVNYAFLDGQVALDTYRECESNKPASQTVKPKPLVFLTGQKKQLPIRKLADKSCIGVAVNKLDKPDIVISFLLRLTANGHQVRLRWHPAQPDRDVSRYKRAFSGNAQVSLSDPQSEPVYQFLARLRCLVAGNTSILLESGVAGICPVYFEFEPADIPDVYGFVRHGLARHAKSADELIEWIEQDQFPLDAEAVRYYSATFGSQWEGREGELVTDLLRKLGRGVCPQSLWGFKKFAKPDEEVQ